MKIIKGAFFYMAFLFAGLALLLTGCDKYDDGDIRKEIGNLKDRIAELETVVSAMCRH